MLLISYYIPLDLLRNSFITLFFCSYIRHLYTLLLLLFVFFIVLSVWPPAVFPKIKPFTFGDTPVFAGQSAQVACSVSEGDSPLELSWTFDGPRDVFGLGVSVLNVGTKTSLLSIDNTDSVHRGNYTCRVTNRAGRTSYTAGLNVHGTYLLCTHLYVPTIGPHFTRVAGRCDMRFSACD